MLSKSAKVKICLYPEIIKETRKQIAELSLFLKSGEIKLDPNKLKDGALSLPEIIKETRKQIAELILLLESGEIKLDPDKLKYEVALLEEKISTICRLEVVKSLKQAILADMKTLLKKMHLFSLQKKNNLTESTEKQIFNTGKIAKDSNKDLEEK